MTIHIGAKPGEIAETVLFPGDPLRAKWAAETFLDDSKLVNETRGMLGMTGTWSGHPVTMQGSGMGMASLSIYANELIRDYGVKTIIRIGSCGGMSPDVSLRDIIVAMTASYTSMPSSTILREVNFAPCADWGLLSAAVREAESRGVSFHVGGIYSSDVFYNERADLADQMIRHGTLAVEMEAAELYTVAARLGARALAVLTVSDHIGTGDSLSSKDRERSFGDMVEISLSAAFSGRVQCRSIPAEHQNQS
ncbi:MAG: purine-nucleoside phosphorylase [Roseovarius sp.]|nr:purine-nucleoside phosphorylase [Roseovarius sp.]MCY4292034.1 purine-nucleoside phosphorylase [Roseovarius sp.]MCY4317431.1 purine-nucleoside phosphorylase [Roseovarius sp.]